MKTTRVLILTTTYLGFNGITSVIMNYYRNINRKKVQFDFAVGLGIHEEIEKEIERLGGKIYKLAARKKNPVKYLIELRKIIKNNDYKVVHVHANSATIYPDVKVIQKAGVSVRIVHSHNSTGNHKIIHKVLKKPFNKSVTHKFACSKLAGDWLYNGKYTIINNGIDIEKFNYNQEIRMQYRKKMNLEGKFVLGHIGHFSYQKNHEYLLEVFKNIYKKNENARLMLLGDGKLRGDIERKIQEFGIEKSVLLLGNRSDTAQLLQAMDLFILPSRFEGLPVVLIEAQAAGLKCIVSDKITKECQVTGRVEYLNLSENKEMWTETILNISMDYRRDDVKENFILSKFNIKNEAKNLEKIYLLCN